MEKLSLTQEWDKVFPKNDKVDHKKVTFHNRYGITLAADMFTPKSVVGKLPAIAVSGPFGAVKEQSSGLYAQKMAEYGFLTVAFDPSFTGESGAVLVMWLLRTSIRKISVRLWIFCPYRRILTQTELVSSVSVVGAVWQSTQQHRTPVSKQLRQ